MAKKKVQFTGVNRKIVQWKSTTTAELKSAISMLTSEGKGQLLNELRGYVNHDPDGSIYSVSWKFPRHGIFIIKGVGRGYMIIDNQVVRAVKKNSAVYTVSGTIERQPQDWFNPVIENRIPVLAQMISDYYADQAVEQIDQPRPMRVHGNNKTYNL